jgi:gliding motility-associated lipoprotein GldH
MRPLFAIVVPLFLMIACETPYYEAEKEIQEGIWTYNDPFSFTFNAKDTVKKYDLLLEIKHSQSYPYQNIYFQLSTVFPDGDTIKDPFSVNLANKFGEWNGDCWGNTCSIQFPIQSNVRFKTIGHHQLSFTQYTRQDSLKGVEEMEFSIVRSTQDQ